MIRTGLHRDTHIVCICTYTHIHTHTFIHTSIHGRTSQGEGGGATAPPPNSGKTVGKSRAKQEEQNQTEKFREINPSAPLPKESPYAHASIHTLISSSFHHLDMTLAVAEALNPNKPNQTIHLYIHTFHTHIYICMYNVCIYVYLCMCIYNVCICIYMYVYVRVRMYACAEGEGKGEEEQEKKRITKLYKSYMIYINICNMHMFIYYIHNYKSYIYDIII